jgi:molecular chaperone GrpE (heat shock protein)
MNREHPGGGDPKLTAEAVENCKFAIEQEEKYLAAWANMTPEQKEAVAKRDREKQKKDMEERMQRELAESREALERAKAQIAQEAPSEKGKGVKRTDNSKVWHEGGSKRRQE